MTALLLKDPRRRNSAAILIAIGARHLSGSTAYRMKNILSTSQRCQK
jgi:hypothetical protein